MATKLRREKDIIQNAISNYLSATTGKYSKYLEGGPTYIKYLQLDDVASTQDRALETVHSLVGNSSPNKYKSIDNVVVYGINALDITNELNERGLQSEINGEFIMVPDSLVPHQNDFFIFQYEGLTEHLFRISDVQYDKASPGKYYRVQYQIFQDNAELIFDNIEDEYEMVYDNIGSSEPSIILKTEALAKEEVSDIVKDLDNKFSELFYDDENDTFVCNHHGKKVWSPYIQHFISKNKIFEGNREFMTEYYLLDINEFSHPNYFKEEIYNNSIFRYVELQDNELEFESGFFSLSEKNLKKCKNLPFFASENEYLVLEPLNILSYGVEGGDMYDYQNAFSFLFGSPDKLFKDVPHTHKLHKFDNAHINNVYHEIKPGDLIYECRRNEIEPTGLYKRKDSENGRPVELFDKLSMSQIINSDYDCGFLFNTIRTYLNKKLVIDNTFLDELNKFKYRSDLKTYIMLPILIYILKNN